MEELEYQNYYAQEDTHWWFVNRYRIIRKIIDKILAGKNNRFNLLDLGCGTGGLLSKVRELKQLKAFGSDISKSGLNFCLKRGLSEVIQADVMKLPFKEGSLDLVLCCEVLDHSTVEIKEALKGIYRICKKGAWVIISDVAFEFLKSEHDRVYHTKHRFNIKEMRQEVGDAGFIISRITYYNFIFFPVLGLIRIFRNYIKNKEKGSDLKETRPFFNNLLIKVLILERLLLNVCDMPWGSSLLCIARK